MVLVYRTNWRMVRLFWVGLIIALFAAVMYAKYVNAVNAKTNLTLGYPNSRIPCQHYPYNVAGRCANYDWGSFHTEAYSHYSQISSRGYAYRNCTDYVAWKLSSLKVNIPRTLGNATDWYGNVSAELRLSKPKVWSVAYMPGNYGHVAFVESVHNDKITVSEYNFYGNGTGSIRTGRVSELGFTAFIDFGARPPKKIIPATNKIKIKPKIKHIDNTKVEQKKKPAARKKVANKKFKSGFFSRFSTTQLLVFAIVFASIGGYTLWKSYADDSIAVGYSNLNAEASHGETLATDSQLTSKEKQKGSRIVRVQPYDSNGRAVYVKSIAAGIYKVCVLSRAVSGSPTGTLIVSKTIDGTALATKSYSAGNYTPQGCVSVTQSASGNLVFTVKVAPVGSVMHFSFITLEKTGSVVEPPPPLEGKNCDGSGGPAGTSSLAFCDDFTGNAGEMVNLNKWRPNKLGSDTQKTTAYNGDMQNCEDPAQVKLDGQGSVQLILDRNSSSDCKLQSGGGTAPYKSGLIESSDHYDFQYGYAEARMYMPGTSSACYNWPGFWTDGNADGVSWPTFLESDIMECLGGGSPQATVHYDQGGHQQKPIGGLSGDRSGWHIFAARYAPSSKSCGGSTPDAVKLTYYYDNNQIGSPFEVCYKNTGQYLILQNDIGEEHGGPLNIPSGGSKVLVDYARVWRL